MEKLMSYSEHAMQQVRERRLLINEVDEWIFDEIAPYLGQRILEIGCGLGNFTQLLLDRELYVGVDTSASSVEHINDRYQSFPNIHAEHVSVNDEKLADLHHYNFDTVISVNVFEHLEDDLGALKNIKQVLKKGKIILVVPAHSWLYGSMDSPIGHFRRYSKKTMRELLSAGQMRCETQKYINFLGAIGWLVNGRIFRQEIPPSGQLRLLNRIIPISRKLESIFNLPVGISLLSVAKVG
jgi:SAM-dependent methyltransferase